MSLEIYITYVFATILILVIPGPTIILVVSQAVTHGRKSVVPLAAGVVLGDFTAMTLSLLGLGAIMSTSATLFILFKWKVQITKIKTISNWNINSFKFS